jgi:hypothetical protein
MACNGVNGTQNDGLSGVSRGISAHCTNGKTSIYLIPSHVTNVFVQNGTLHLSICVLLHSSMSRNVYR